MTRPVCHCVLHGFFRMQAIHSAKEISSTSGRRRSTLLRRSLQPDGGPRSSPRRSSPERLFLEYFITCPACYLNGRDANSSLHHSLLQVSAHSRDEAVKDFTVHEKCCHKHPTPGNTSGNRTTSCRAIGHSRSPSHCQMPCQKGKSPVTGTGLSA